MGTAAFALVVCMTAVACNDEAQEQTSLDAATSDAAISDAGIFDGANANDVGPGGADILSATFIVGVAATGSALPVGSPVEASCVGGKVASKTGPGHWSRATYLSSRMASPADFAR